MGSGPTLGSQSGPSPVIWVTTSQLLGLVASPQLAPL